MEAAVDRLLHVSYARKHWDFRTSANSCELVVGGEGGIRTPDTVTRMPHFECGAFNHSATSPEWNRRDNVPGSADYLGDLVLQGQVRAATAALRAPSTISNSRVLRKARNASIACRRKSGRSAMRTMGNPGEMLAGYGFARYRRSSRTKGPDKGRRARAQYKLFAGSFINSEALA